MDLELPDGWRYIGSGQHGTEWRAQAVAETPDGDRYVTGYGATEEAAIADLIRKLAA